MVQRKPNSITEFVVVKWLRDRPGVAFVLSLEHFPCPPQTIAPWSFDMYKLLFWLFEVVDFPFNSKVTFAVFFLFDNDFCSFVVLQD